ncbi:MAG: hypothetical protein LKM30_00635 [Bacilli bacterium]|nr:hypothetical protein [Bacilli bacterium]
MKVKYQYDYHKYMVIDVDESQVELVKELNKDYEKNKKNDDKYHEKTVSFDDAEAFDRAVYSFNRSSYDDDDEDDLKIQKKIERRKARQALKLKKAMPLLTEKQRYVLNEHVYKNKHFSDIAKTLGINRKSAQKLYKSAIKKLKKICNQAKK